MHSTVPYALDALTLSLGQLFASDQPPVQVVESLAGEWTGDRIVVVAVEGEHFEVTQTSGSLGNLRRDETYDVPCMVAATAGTSSAADAKWTAWGLLARIEDAITTDFGLSGPGGIEIGESMYGSVRFAQIDRVVQEVGWFDRNGNAGCRLLFHVRCEATIERTSP